MTDIIDRARSFAAKAHAGQTRKGAAQEPYFTHLEDVAALVTGFGGDPEMIAAAWLHDTVEDCEGITEATIRAEFGAAIAGLVMEMTDDKSLPKAERKRLQVEHAPHKSDRAKLIKVADKIANLRALAASPPADWDMARRTAYVDWACAVVDALPALPQDARAAFDDAVRAARASIAGTG